MSGLAFAVEIFSKAIPFVAGLAGAYVVKNYASRVADKSDIVLSDKKGNIKLIINKKYLRDKDFLNKSMEKAVFFEKKISSIVGKTISQLKNINHSIKLDNNSNFDFLIKSNGIDLILEVSNKINDTFVNHYSENFKKIDKQSIFVIIIQDVEENLNTYKTAIMSKNSNIKNVYIFSEDDMNKDDQKIQNLLNNFLNNTLSKIND